ncbi:hypothetical protein PCE1_003443 [Barthelona sp. PCE]
MGEVEHRRALLKLLLHQHIELRPKTENSVHTSVLKEKQVETDALQKENEFLREKNEELVQYIQDISINREKETNRLLDIVSAQRKQLIQYQESVQTYEEHHKLTTTNYKSKVESYVTQINKYEEQLSLQKGKMLSKIRDLEEQLAEYKEKDVEKVSRDVGSQKFEEILMRADSHRIQLENDRKVDDMLSSRTNNIEKPRRPLAATETYVPKFQNTNTGRERPHIPAFLKEIEAVEIREPETSDINVDSVLSAVNSDLKTKGSYRLLAEKLLSKMNVQ